MRIILLFVLGSFLQAQAQVQVGARSLSEYVPDICDERLALVVNQTSLVEKVHLLDTLLALELEVVKVFAPEHGFRGEKDAGETIKNNRDPKTDIEIISLYGKNKKPTPQQLSNVDVVIFDIQDVGARFYTYISTMHYVMEACAETSTKMIVLDRPNPNGHYVAGPVLDASQQSFVGMHPVPIVHGMTIGEYAMMINGEGWLKASQKCDLEVVKVKNWNHKDPYSLPVKPSPNLPNDRAIALYPSLCLFEGTTASVGRGTTQQFQIIGHPDYPDTSFKFVPKSRSGAKYPKHENKICFGVNLSQEDTSEFTLAYLIDFYGELGESDDGFFNDFFKKLAGTDLLQQQIEQGLSEDEIIQSWSEDLENFKLIRKKYLLYPDFE